MSRLETIPVQLQKIYRKLLNHFGHRHWWPGDTPFEVCIGAILTQNTAWTNVEKAIRNLKEAGLMDPFLLHEADSVTVGELIRPSGYYNIKTKRMKAFLKVLVEKYRGDISGIAREGSKKARSSLLDINGIGNETADSILLYAAGLTVFVVDAYTIRIFTRLGLLDDQMKQKSDRYDQAQSFFMQNLPEDTELFKDYHAQIVELGKNHCHKSRPKCESCPIGKICGRINRPKVWV